VAARRIILDCDPGIDDAVALLLALASPAELELAAVACVAGNVPLAQTEFNARRVLTLAAHPEVPVYPGCVRPLMAAAGTAAPVHGADGLGNVALEPPAFAVRQQHAVDFLVECILAAPPGSLTLCATGPLSNVAMAIVKAPEIVGRLAEVVIMGGACFGPGNATPTAEFNFHYDPHAAEIVLSAGLEVTLFPLDVTLQARIDEARLAAVARGGRVAAKAAEMMAVYGGGDAALHDALVIAYLIAPGLFSGLRAHVEVVTAAGPTFGQSVARVRDKHLAGRKTNALVMTGIDDDGFFALLAERLGRL
jgi:inosine-uridine nucleoside N-ribohydrolase